MRVILYICLFVGFGYCQDDSDGIPTDSMNSVVGDVDTMADTTSTQGEIPLIVFDPVPVEENKKDTYLLHSKFKENDPMILDLGLDSIFLAQLHGNTDLLFEDFNDPVIPVWEQELLCTSDSCLAQYASLSSANHLLVWEMKAANTGYVLTLQDYELSAPYSVDSGTFSISEDRVTAQNELTAAIRSILDMESITPYPIKRINRSWLSRLKDVNSWYYVGSATAVIITWIILISGDETNEPVGIGAPPAWPDH